MKITYYDDAFNMNEWFVILLTLILFVLVFKLPKIFPPLESIAYVLYGIFVGMFFDHTISVPPLNYYDVNDNSSYQLIDFISYIMYGPYSYLFIYLYVKLHIKGYKHIFYILTWVLFSLLMEWVGDKVGLFHYRNGFKLIYSIPIYLFVQTIQIFIFHHIQLQKLKNRHK